MPQGGFSIASSLRVLLIVSYRRGEKYCPFLVEDWQALQPTSTAYFILIISEVIEMVTRLLPLCTDHVLLHTCMTFSRTEKSTSSKLHFRGITNIPYEKSPTSVYWGVKS